MEAIIFKTELHTAAIRYIDMSPCQVYLNVIEKNPDAGLRFDYSSVRGKINSARSLAEFETIIVYPRYGTHLYDICMYLWWAIFCIEMRGISKESERIHPLFIHTNSGFKVY